MYVKIVRHLDEAGVTAKNGIDLVVPTEYLVYETKEVKYKRVRNSAKEFFKKPFICEAENHLWVGSVPGNKDFFEYIVITLYMKENCEPKTLIAMDCTLYIMNDNGKTIDSLICQ